MTVDAEFVVVVARDMHDALCVHGATISVDTPAGTFTGCTAESGGESSCGRWRVRLNLNPTGADGKRSVQLRALRDVAMGGQP